MLKNIPDHLRIYIGEQKYSNYSPEDQAVWRYTMKQLKDFLSVHAHRCYLDGLRRTGITAEEIPRINDINAKLQKYGWGAVPVSGFIPPAAFMELQSLGFLPIASEMRSIEHIHYTPAPDIVHEAAGHAPIIVNPEFSRYLKKYAEVSAKAIISKEDIDLYEAIRKLSDAKEKPGFSSHKIKELEKDLIEKSKRISFVSEAGLLSRMNWWTAEYGLIGKLSEPRIYGAGLLSSIGESRNSLKHHIRKIPLGLNCLDYSYDITEQQPQLFVTPSFNHLTKTLIKMSKQMAYKQGGKEALEKVRQARTVNTIELDTGLQISGLLNDFYTDGNEVFFFKYDGPTQLSYGGKEIPGHGKKYHSQGYSSPLGQLSHTRKCLSKMTRKELVQNGIKIGRFSALSFASGMVLSGTPVKIWKKGNTNLIIQFKNCTITFNNQILFHPDWGNFDMALGQSVKSAFGGPADRHAYGLMDSFKPIKVPRRIYTLKQKNKFEFYRRVQKLRLDIRTQKLSGAPADMQLEKLVTQLLKSHKDLWLAAIELLEIYHLLPRPRVSIEKILVAHLEKLRKNNKDLAIYIDDGIRLANNK